MKVAFAGAFAAQMAEPVRARFALPCEVVVDDEDGIVARLSDVDVLVSMGFSAVMAKAAPRLRLVQVPGATSLGERPSMAVIIASTQAGSNATRRSMKSGLPDRRS